MGEIDAVVTPITNNIKEISNSEEELLLFEQPDIVNNTFFDCTEIEPEDQNENRYISEEYVDAYKQILAELASEKEQKRDEKEDIIRERDALKHEVNKLKKKLDKVNAKHSKTDPHLQEMNSKHMRLACCINTYEDSIKSQDERYDVLKETAAAILKCAKQSKKVKEEFLAIDLEKLNNTLRKCKTLSTVLEQMIKVKSSETIQLEDAYNEILEELYL